MCRRSSRSSSVVERQGRSLWSSSRSRKRAHRHRSPSPPRRGPRSHRYDYDSSDDRRSRSRRRDQGEDVGREDDVRGSRQDDGDRPSVRFGSSDTSADEDFLELEAAAGCGVSEEQRPPPAQEHGSSDGHWTIAALLAADDSEDDDDVVRRGHTPAPPVGPAPAPPPESSAPAPAPPESTPPAPAPPADSSSSESSSVIRNVTVENTSAFDCGICYQPLKSPIFQCTVGHVVCSACHDRLEHAMSCHLCRAPLPHGYVRCNAMEQVVDSIRVPCPHAAHGCTVSPVYHGRDAHARACAHRPCQCHCPDEGCDFAAAAPATLVEHLAAVHGWRHCSSGITAGTRGLTVGLREGLNVVVVVTAGATTREREQQYTLVLNVQQSAPPRVCNVITAFCIHPRNDTPSVSLQLDYRDPDFQQTSRIKVECTDLSNGMPDPKILFVVPCRGPSAPGGQDDDDVTVTIKDIRLWT